MRFYVYIICSLLDGSYYKGFTEDPLVRLQAHNNKESTYTSSKVPWTLVYIEIFESKREALIREKAVKKYGYERIQRLISSPKNSLKKLDRLKGSM